MRRIRVKAAETEAVPTQRSSVTCVAGPGQSLPVRHVHGDALQHSRRRLQVAHRPVQDIVVRREPRLLRQIRVRHVTHQILSRGVWKPSDLDEAQAIWRRNSGQQGGSHADKSLSLTVCEVRRVCLRPRSVADDVHVRHICVAPREVLGELLHHAACLVVDHGRVDERDPTPCRHCSWRPAGIESTSATLSARFEDSLGLFRLQRERAAARHVALKLVHSHALSDAIDSHRLEGPCDGDIRHHLR